MATLAEVRRSLIISRPITDVNRRLCSRRCLASLDSAWITGHSGVIGRPVVVSGLPTIRQGTRLSLRKNAASEPRAHIQRSLSSVFLRQVPSLTYSFEHMGKIVENSSRESRPAMV